MELWGEKERQNAASLERCSYAFRSLSQSRNPLAFSDAYLDHWIEEDQVNV